MIAIGYRSARRSVAKNNAQHENGCSQSRQMFDGCGFHLKIRYTLGAWRFKPGLSADVSQAAQSIPDDRFVVG